MAKWRIGRGPAGIARSAKLPKIAEIGRELWFSVQDRQFHQDDILLPMIRLSVMYPAAPGSRFNWDYYLGPHLELSRKLLTPRGLVRTEIDRGIGGLPPGTSAPYHAVGHLFFRTLAELQNALAATAADFIADERNYTDVPSVVQISEVVE